MSEVRMKALEAVAEAARATVREVGGTDGLFEALRNLRALDALPAATPGDVVEVVFAVWEDTRDGDIMWLRAGGSMDRQRNGYRNWTRLGTTRLALEKETRDAT